MPGNYDLSGLSVMAVDDCRFMRNVTSRMLQTLGVGEVEVARDGQDALMRLRDCNPDLVICDWEMAGMSGPDFVRELRTSPNSPNRYTPVVMLTGYTERAKVEAARDMGVTEFLAKPVSAEGLYKRIVSIIENPRPFVRTDDFFGPCRRRKALPHDGPERRVGEVVSI